MQKNLQVLCDLKKLSVVHGAEFRNTFCQCVWKKAYSHLNLAVSGSISSSSRTGERGTLAENFSVWKKKWKKNQLCFFSQQIALNY